MYWEIFLEMLFLLAPMGIANTAPVWGKKIIGFKNWQTPIDFGFKYKGRRLLGDNKTYRGLVLGIISGCLVGAIQLYLVNNYDWFANLKITDDYPLNMIILGGLLGFFALLGDALKSFFKRQLKIAPGKSWPVLDQIDYIIGAYILIGFLFDLTPTHYIIGLLTYSLIHPVISYSAYLLKLKKDKF